MTTSTVRRWLALPRLAAVAGRALLACALAWAAPAALAAPASGSIIGNQAAATYTDASGTSQSATSNLVQTVVQQVGGFTFTGADARNAAPGGTAYFPYTLTNTGNGANAFQVGLVNNTGTFNFSAVAVYLDADGNGLPDSTTSLWSGSNFTTPALAAGGTYRFVVALTVPAGATVGQTDNVTVTASTDNATIYFGAPTSIARTATVTAAATTPVFSVSKSIAQSQGGTSASNCSTNFTVGTCVVVTYTLSYTNTGTAAGHLYLRDAIGGAGTATAGMQYVTGSARWNGNATALTDISTGETLSGIAYQTDVSGSTTTLQAVIADVQPGSSGTLSFNVGILPAASAGTGSTSNTAEFGVATGTTVPGTAPTTQTTNVSAYTVSARYSVVANNTTSAPTDVSPDTDASGVNVNTVASAVAGSTILFSSNVIHNTGNSTDTFNIVLSNGAPGFPNGTLFTAFRSDGNTPLTDSNGDGIIDTGPVAAGSNVTISVRVAIPANACSLTTCGTGATNMTVHIQARSVGDTSQTNKVYGRLSANGLTAPTVSLGSGTTSPGTLWSSGAAIVTTAVDAGTSVSFDLVVRNTAATGSPADTYDLLHSGSVTNFIAGTAPATSADVPLTGATVTFREGLCSANGRQITNTGSIGPVGSVAPPPFVNVCAVVTTPAGAAAGTYDVYLRAVSPNTGAVSTLRNAVTINAVPGLSLSPSGTGQVVAGGSVVYPHILTNTGTVSCPAPGFTALQSQSANGWTAVVYDDVNGDGLLDSGDTVVSSTATPLAVGATPRRLLVRVFAPGGAAVGAVDVLTFTVTDATCGTASVTDRTTVMSGQLRLVKTQALDATCDGTADATASVSQVLARPDQCVIYTVVATNLGSTAVTTVSITDATPAFTRLRASGANAAPTCSAGTVVSPGLGNSGALGCNGIASLAAGGSVTLVFSVRIDP